MSADKTNRNQKKNTNESHKNSLLWIWRVTGGYKSCILVLLLIQAIYGLCGVVSAMLFRDLIDQAVAGFRSGFFRAAAMLLGLELGQIALSAFYRFMSEWTSSTVENRFKSRLFACLLYKDYAAVTAVHSGDWINRLTSDAREVTGGVLTIFPGLAGMVVRLVGALAALFFLTPAFFYVLIPMGILLLAVTALFRNILKRLHKKIQEANGAVLAFFQERLESMMILRVFSMEKGALNGAEQRMEAHKAARMKRNHFSNVCNSGFSLIVGGGYILCAACCGYGILKGTLSYGTFTAVLQLIGQVQGPFANLSGIVPRYYAMLASAERLMEAEKYEDDGNETHVTAEEIARFYKEDFQSMGVRDAGFSYQNTDGTAIGSEEKAVIDHLDMDIRKGEYVAFTGHSGCGKSTLLKLLMCLYPLDHGERYLMAEKENREIQIPLTAAWRGLFAYVPQGNQLMSGTIREIIAFGDPGAMRQEERLSQALRISCAKDFVSELPDGIDTVLGERGCGLSEGQMQRIAIARAVFSERPVLILDESTSSLDETTEQMLLKNLRQMTDKTVLIITHRPAALEICDRRIDLTEKAYSENTTA